MLPTRESLAKGPVLDYARAEPRVDRPGLRWARAGFGVTALAMWFIVTMAGASLNTSWEHHPFAGPFIIWKESGSPGEYVFSTFLLACILAPLAHWVWTDRRWGVVVAAAASLGTVWMSCTFAAWASC